MRKAVGLALLLAVLAVVPIVGYSDPTDVVHCHTWSDAEDHGAVYVEVYGMTVGSHGSLGGVPEPIVGAPPVPHDHDGDGVAGTQASCF